MTRLICEIQTKLDHARLVVNGLRLIADFCAGLPDLHLVDPSDLSAFLDNVHNQLEDTLAEVQVAISETQKLSQTK